MYVKCGELMIKKMRRKFTAIAMFSLAVVMIVLLTGINAVNFIQINNRADRLLSMLADNDGQFPQSMRERQKNDFRSGVDREKNSPPEVPKADRPKDPPPDGPREDEEFKNSAPNDIMERKEKPHQKAFGEFFDFFERSDVFGPEISFETRYFTVKTDNNGNIFETDISSIAAVDEDEAKEYAENVLKKKSGYGYKGNYRYLVSDKDYGRLVIFIDRSNQLDMAVKVFAGSVFVAAICLFVVFLLVYFMSGRAIKPMIENMEKQKQFITDAGHEIKTPLTIISANNDVLELTCGKNEWTASIKNQVKRLSELVNNLLMLSKLDEEGNTLCFEECLLGGMLNEVLNDFLPVMQKKNITLSTAIDEKSVVYADKGSVRNLLSILTDNAAKYVDNGGIIDVKLGVHGDNVRLEMFNTCKDFKEEETEKLFNRFYRADKSRSRESGGYGIGLSVAQALVKANNGKISAKPKDDGIVFVAELKKFKIQSKV